MSQQTMKQVIQCSKIVIASAALLLTAQSSLAKTSEFEAGKGIFPGEYILYPDTKGDASYELYSIETGELIASDTFSVDSIITVCMNEKIILTDCSTKSISKKTVLDAEKSGSFRVGIDIEPGTYILEFDPHTDTVEKGSYAVFPDSKCHMEDMIASEEFQDVITTLVELKEGEIFRITDAKIIDMIPYGEAPAQPETPAQTEAPAPETEAPAVPTQPETPAQTEAPAPETEAPAAPTQPETPAQTEPSSQGDPNSSISLLFESFLQSR